MPTFEIDDTDPSISYSGPWHLSGNSNEFQSTTHYVGVEGAQLSVAFEGIAITVYGTITAPEDFPGGSTQYAIDGSVFAVYKSPTVPTPQYHTQFFQSSILSHGKHSLLVTTISSNTSFYFDSFVITTPDNVDTSSGAEANTHTITKEKTIVAPPSPSPSPTPFLLPLSSSPPPSHTPSPPLLPSSGLNDSSNTNQGTQTGSSSELTPTSGVNSQPSFRTPIPDSRTSKRVPIGAIVGATISGVLVVTLVIFFLWHRRRKSKKYVELPKQLLLATSRRMNKMSSVTPFVVSEAREAENHSLMNTPFDSVDSLGASFFTNLSNAANRKGIQEGFSIDSEPTPADGRVTKSHHSPPGSPRAPPATLPLLVGPAEDPSSTAWGGRGHFEIYWETADDLLPPAYQAAER